MGIQPPLTRMARVSLAYERRNRCNSTLGYDANYFCVLIDNRTTTCTCLEFIVHIEYLPSSLNIPSVRIILFSYPIMLDLTIN